MSGAQTTKASETGSAPASALRAVELHSVDYIPQRERHGKAWNQFTLWFAANAELSTLAVGLIGISLGLGLWWTLLAVVLGLGFGTFFMAFHSVQGPRLGISQMIQSRPQFGYYGALLPQAIAVLLFIGFNVFNTIIAGQALHTVLPVATNLTLVIAFLAALVIAFGGYDWIHFVQKWGTYAFLICFGVLSIGAIFTVHLPAAQANFGSFKLTPFLVVFGATAAYQLSEAPYVSDYSRYLNRRVTAKECFLWTYAGAGLGSLWMIALGAFLLAANPTGQTVDVVFQAGNGIFNGFGSITMLVAFGLLVSTTAMNMYCGSLSTLSIVDTVKSVRPRLSFRVSALLFIGILSTAFALTLPQNFLSDYSNFLTILLYFLTPWTAVNLVDFYLVRRGDYSVKDIFNPAGIYGRWQWRGLLAYALGFAVMIPFFSTAIYTGPVANALSGADLSIFIGLPVSAGLYWLFSRGIDHQKERALAEQSARELEAGDAIEGGHMSSPGVHAEHP